MKRMAEVLVLLLTGCAGIPKNVQPVGGFKLEKYLGRWYEIARLDHSLEQGLSRVTADYSLRGDGGVRVVNRGYSEEERAWKVAEGKAFFVKNPDQGYLKVSFFGPFYGSYVILELDHDDYRYAGDIVPAIALVDAEAPVGARRVIRLPSRPRHA